MYLIFGDIMIIFCKGIKSHSESLLEVFRELQSAGLNIRVGNCNLSLKSLEYLGHVVTADDIKMQEGLIKCIWDYPDLLNVECQEIPRNGGAFPSILFRTILLMLNC